MENFRQNKKDDDWRVLHSFFFPLPKKCQKGNYFKTLAKIPCFFHKRVAKFHPNWGSGHSCVYFYDLSCAEVSPLKSELGILGTVAALQN
jgi:hypothetical protein